ncbi:hypothetical protein E4T48_03316 [Aureobasidium sp. EXF-10727]|nr:hypothetical protein E4T48_03316 [Aureobasidium sp. EXF-10727]
MPPSSGPGASLSTIRLLYSPIVTVRVGPDKQEFCIHKELLCSKSTYFARALSGHFKEAKTCVVELEDVRVVLFRVFVAWLYTGKVAYESSDPGASPKDEFTQLDTALEEEYPYEMEEDENQVDDYPDDLANFETEAPQSWTHLILGALFVLADRLDVPAFKRQVLDAIAKRNTALRAAPNDSAVLLAYANTTKNSPLRRLLVHLFAFNVALTRSQDTYEHLPVPFLAGVMVTMSRRLPSKQCESCHKSALADNGDACMNIDDVNKEEDLAPYEHNLCFYHEHKDSEEENACRAAREGETGESEK